MVGADLGYCQKLIQKHSPVTVKLHAVVGAYSSSADYTTRWSTWHVQYMVAAGLRTDMAAQKGGKEHRLCDRRL